MRKLLLILAVLCAAPPTLSAQATIPAPAGLARVASPVTLTRTTWRDTTRTGGRGEVWTWAGFGALFGGALGGAWALRELRSGESYLPHLTAAIGVGGGALVGGLVGAIAYEGTREEPR